MKKLCAVLITTSLINLAGSVCAQQDSQKVFRFSGYVDAHYVSDLNATGSYLRPYGSNPQYVNQFGLAYSYLQAEYQKNRFGFRAAAHYGEIEKVMYSDEPEPIKYIREISAWYSFGKNEIQLGIMPAVYGAETFINKDNLHATRAVMTDFAPDFEAGIRFKRRMTERWNTLIQVTRGWQVINDNNGVPAFGMVNTYETSNKSLINWGLFAGEEVYKAKHADRQMKLYSNMFAWIHLGSRWIIMPMLDVGAIKDPVTNQYNSWVAYGASVRYAFRYNWGVAARYERIYDPHAVINELINSYSDGFQFHGVTGTLEYLPSPRMSVRWEWRYSYASKPLFPAGTEHSSNSDVFAMMAVAYQFNK